MNRLLLSLLLFFAAMSGGNGQTNYWTEEFATPEGWTLQDNWNIEAGILAFSWDPTIYNFDQYAVSPFITLDDKVTELIVKQSLLVYNPTENENAQIIVSTSENDFVIWDYNLLNGNWGNSSGSEIIFPMEGFSGETIQLKFRTFGETTFNWSAWQIFQVTLMASYEYDLMVTNIQGPKNLDLMQQGNWVVEVSNFGSEPVSGYAVNLLDSKSGEVVDQIVDMNTLEAGESQVYGFSWTPYSAFNTLIYGQVLASEDQFSTNNLSSGLFLRIEPELDYSILVWDNDNGIQSIVCPEKGDLITPITGLTRALDDAGLEYDLFTFLPDNLEDYTLVIATLGNYCLS